jgi:hypothetical protein
MGALHVGEHVIRRILFVLIAAFGLFGSAGQAQTFYGGVGGTLFTAFDFGSELGIRALVGVDEVSGRGSNFGVRASVDFYLNSLAFAIGVDGYTKIPAGSFDLVAGAGLRFVSVGDTAFLLQALLGAEFPISRSVSTFLDVQPGLLIVPATGSTFFLGFTAGIRTSF